MKIAMRPLVLSLIGILIGGCATEAKYNTDVAAEKAKEYRECAMSKAKELDDASSAAADIAKEAIGLCFDRLDAINSLLREANKEHPYYGLYANNYTNGLRDQVTMEVVTEMLKSRPKQ